MDSLPRSLSAIAVALGLATTPVSGQAGRVVHDTVRSSALAGNLLGDSPTREVLVYLPPSYDRAPLRRYPVLYLLHGFLAHPNLWLGQGYLRQFNLAQTMDSLVGAGTVREFLIVMPDGSTQLGGSHYTSSATNGDWEKFLARELVDHVDRTYRTIRRATSDREVFARWERQSVLALVSAHPAALRSLKGLAFDVGDSDQFGFAPQVQSLDSLLNSLAVPHMFDEYHGRHSDKVPERMTAHVLPFFSGVLEFEDTASH